MTISVTPGALDTICDYADGFVVHVRRADDVDAAVRALAQVKPDIVALSATPADDPDGPIVSNPVLAPDGPMVRIARLDASEDDLARVPQLVAARLVAAGVTDAVIAVPEPGGPLDRLDACPSAVVLRLFPPPAGEQGAIPATWIDIACEWVLGDLAPVNTVPVRLLAIEFDVPVADAPSIFHQSSLARGWCDIMNGDVTEKVRTASVTFGGTPHVALAAGGPGCDTAALLARYDLLCDVARDLAGEVGYACVDIEGTFEGIGLGLGGGGWRDRGGASPNLVAGELGDVLVPDAFPFQVLGKGHLGRLTDQDTGLVGEPLSEGRMAVTIGEPADWLPFYDARAEVQAEGFEVLAPLLATDAEVDELLARRPHRQVGEDGPVATGLPDLADIRLETLPHSRRGLHLTLLELVSWLAHEPHSDAPRCVSPVVSSYARWFASALGDDRRQELKARARLLIGTGGAGFRSGAVAGGRANLSRADAERAWLATDWLIRGQAASWLRHAGLVEAASQLESIGPTSDHQELVRAVDVLGSAITIASRRLDLTASMAAPGAAHDGESEEDDAALARLDATDVVEQAGWDAWERASEASGWVAASEAAAVGIPAELAYATDLCVIECARDARTRDELDASGRSAGDRAWSAALHAVADEAWTEGWKAAHPAVDARAVLSLESARRRATRAVTARAGADADHDGIELAVETAEAAAKECLTRAALGPPTWRGTEHPWDAARAAAAACPEGGSVWAAIDELAAGAVDERPWQDGMSAARAAVDHVLADAPRQVARAVSAAMAREAAGLAARGVAVRAAAVALAHGGTGPDVTEAAQVALGEVTAQLQDEAFALLDRMLAVGREETAEGRCDDVGAASGDAGHGDGDGFDSSESDVESGSTGDAGHGAQLEASGRGSLLQLADRDQRAGASDARDLIAGSDEIEVIDLVDPAPVTEPSASAPPRSEWWSAAARSEETS